MWVKDIQKLANLTNRSFPESAAEEIHFWSSIGEALEMTNTELRYRRGDMGVIWEGVQFGVLISGFPGNFSLLKYAAYDTIPLATLVCSLLQCGS